MPRADRLFALYQLLASPVARPLEWLAEQLETSPRSIYRDLADLEARGVAIERTGSRYRMVPGAGARSLPLTDAERALLAITLSNPSVSRNSAFAPQLAKLRIKLAATEPGNASPIH